MKPLMVVALGGNALLQAGEEPSMKAQLKNAKLAAKHILPLLKTNRLILTHGNGPQVGSSLIRVERAKGEAYPLSLDYCVAQTQGEIGHVLEQALRSLKPRLHVACLQTHVIVDKKDPAFSKPTKPIGPFFTKSQVKNWKVPFVHQQGKGYRRVVPSPKPKNILAIDAIEALVKKNILVIAGGGGGVPVIQTKTGLKGVEAVIDKDLASAKLANELKCKELCILTEVDQVSINFGTKQEEKLEKVTFSEVKAYHKQGQFPAGSMGPKIEAAMEFLKRGGKKVYITSPKKLHQTLLGKAGTTIVR